MKPLLRDLLLPALLVVANLLVFAPAAIYAGNAEEFYAPFWSILARSLAPGLVALAALVLIGSLPPAALRERARALIGSLGVLTWLQGNLLLWRYGLVGGEELDLASGRWRGWLDGALWLGLLLAAVAFPRKLRPPLRLAVPGLLVAQLAWVSFAALREPARFAPRGEGPALEPPAQIFAFSPERNVLQIVLDELQSDVLARILDSDPQRYGSAFDGFTFFPDTLSVFATTWMSIPALLTGEVYRNDVPTKEYLETVFASGRSLPRRFERVGFELGLVVLGGYEGFAPEASFLPPVPYGADRGRVVDAAARDLLRLALFRSLPHFLKPLALSSEKVSATEQYEGARLLASRLFVEDLIQRSNASASRPTYKFLHLVTTHWPAVLGRGCEPSARRLPFNWENIEVQARCAVDQVVALLERMKALGVYDETLIVISSDHGYFNVQHSARYLALASWDPSHVGGTFVDEETFAQVVSSASATLLVKRAGERGGLRRSSAPTSLLDVPATIAREALGKPDPPPGDDPSLRGRSVFSVAADAPRTRTYFDYRHLPRGEFLDQLVRYQVDGRIREPGSWRLAAFVPPAGTSFETARIDFGTPQSLPFLRTGWSSLEANAQEVRDYAWALGREASLFLALSGDRPLRLVATLKAPTSGAPQVVGVFVDDVRIATWSVPADWRWRRFEALVSPRRERSATSVVRFEFARYLQPTARDPRPLAVLFDTLEIAAP